MRHSCHEENMQNLRSIHVQLDHDSEEDSEQVSHCSASREVVHYPSKWILEEENHDETQLVWVLVQCLGQREHYIIIGDTGKCAPKSE